jgi:hypothetical protein
MVGFGQLEIGETIVKHEKYRPVRSTGVCMDRKVSRIYG